MRARHLSTQKNKIALWLIVSMCVVGIWAAVFWMWHALRVVEGRERVTVSGLVSDVAGDRSWLSVGSSYHASDAQIFMMPKDAAVVDAQGENMAADEIIAGVYARVTGYMADRVAVAEDVRVLKEPPIIVYEPAPRASVSGSVVVSGMARVFENQFVIQLVTASGTVIRQLPAHVDASEAGRYGNFSVTMPLVGLSDGMFFIRAFDPSPKDGSPLGVVDVPIVVRAVLGKVVKVFWGRSGAVGDECRNVYGADRNVAATSSVARAAIAALLAGPTDAEKADGYFSSIPADVTIQKLSIVDGTAYIDFDKALEDGVGGSCRVAAIRAQITRTLSQFPSIVHVVVSVDGRVEDVLQP